MTHIELLVLTVTACDCLDDLLTQGYLSELLRVTALSSAVPFLEELYSSELLLLCHELMEMEVMFTCVNQMGHLKLLMLYMGEMLKRKAEDITFIAQISSNPQLSPSVLENSPWQRTHTPSTDLEKRLEHLEEWCVEWEAGRPQTASDTNWP